MEEKNKKKEVWRAVKFALFSASAGIIETVSMILCEEVIKIPGHYVCYTIALVLSVLWNFTFNRKFTFQSAANVPMAMFLVFLFYVPFAPFTIWLEYFLGDVHGWSEYVVLAINMALNLSLEYLWDSKVVYKGQMDNNERATGKKESETSSEQTSSYNNSYYKLIGGILFVFGMASTIYGNIINNNLEARFKAAQYNLINIKTTNPGSTWMIIGIAVAVIGLGIFFIGLFRKKEQKNKKI